MSDSNFGTVKAHHRVAVVVAWNLSGADFRGLGRNQYLEVGYTVDLVLQSAFLSSPAEDDDLIFIWPDHSCVVQISYLMVLGAKEIRDYVHKIS
jgi:hypothetical protein